MPAVAALLDLARAFAPGFQLPMLLPEPPEVGGDSPEERIRKAEARYQTLVEQIPAVTFMASFENGLSEIYVSPHIEAMLGYSAKEWIDDPILWYQRLHPADKQRWNEEFSRTVSWAEPFKADYRFLAKDGRVVWIHGEARVVRDALDRPSFVQGIGYDITELKNAEEVLRRSQEDLEALVAARTTELALVNRSLQKAKDEADRANRAKSDFLSRMSHELRTPLNAILGFGQLLEADLTRPDDVESIQQVMRAGHHLLGLINEVLDLASIEAGKTQIALENLPIAPIIRDVLQLLKPLAAMRRVELKFDPDDSSVLADPQRLKQVLLNLLSNAIKYNCVSGRVTVRCERTAQHLRIGVADTGPGISPEDVAKIFNPFERLRAAETVVEGTGLGLAVCQRLVSLMNGALGVESQPGSGSTFWFELPTAQIPAASAAGAAASPLAAGDLSCTVLYIEDNKSNRSLLQRIFQRRREVAFITATKGGEGLQLARDHLPDLILLDLYLPDISGEVVLHELRARAETAGIPVIMISADATPGQAERLLAAGAQAYLTKPLDFSVFLETVDRTLNEAAASLRDNRRNFERVRLGEGGQPCGPACDDL